MSGLGIIINRNASGYRDSLVCSGELDVADVYETGRVDEIDAASRDFRRRDIDLLVIWGGDGTNHHVVTSLIRNYGARSLPKIVFLPAGKHNACARSIGMSGSAASILERVLRRYRAGEPLRTFSRGLLRVNHGDEVQFGFTLATGYIYRFFETMLQTNWNTPAKTAALLASMFGAFCLGSRRIDEMFRNEPTRICIGENWLDWPENNGIAAATMEQVGMGIKPFSRAGEAESCFHAMAFRITPAHFARVAWSLARGRLGDHPQHVDRVTDRLVVESDAPIPYACDGDLFCAGTRLEITSGPRLQLVSL